MESNLNMTILNEINENFIKQAFNEEIKQNYEELLKFENFLNFLYKLNLQIRWSILKKLTENFFKIHMTFLKNLKKMLLKMKQNWMIL